MSKYEQIWYCEEHDHWTDDPEDFAQYKADDMGIPVSLSFRPGKRVNLADYVSAEDVIEHLDNMDDLCGEDDSMFPTSTIPKEKVEELDKLLKQWAATVDYPWWHEDLKQPCITVAAEPTCIEQCAN